MAKMNQFSSVVFFLLVCSPVIHGSSSNLLQILREFEILKDLEILSEEALLDKMREGMARRGATELKSIGRRFRIMDDDYSNSLNLEEFRKGMSILGLSVEESGRLFPVIDKDSSNSVSFEEFLQAARPPMNEYRTSIVKSAFQKADKTGDGVLTVDDLKGVYNARHNAKYLNGEWTEAQVFQDFLKTFDSPTDPDNRVTLEEFMKYYSGLSASIDNDAYFDLMMRNAWKLQ